MIFILTNRKQCAIIFANETQIGVFNMPKYMTKQRRLLLDYLAEHTDERISARQIADDLRENQISLSAVYRNLAELEKDGQISGCMQEKTHEMFYRYSPKEKCSRSIHLSCRVCGKCFHMETHSAELMVSMVEKEHGFVIDRENTMIYGICSDCRK